MDKVFENLLVGSPNGGGLLHVHEGRVHKIDMLDTTGLFVHKRKLLRGIQPALVIAYGERVVELNPADVAFGDIHDVLIHDDRYYLVGTWGNEVVCVDSAGVELERWKFPGEDDSWHINCIAIWNGRIVFSAFGEFSGHREYKGKSTGTGFVRDLLTGETLISGLTQPHSLVSVEGDLLVANSGARQLLQYRSDGTIRRKLYIDGYVRGLAISGEMLYLGLSKSRNAPLDDVSGGTLLALDKTTWSEVGRLPLPVNEVYSILPMAAEDAGFIVSMIASHSAKLLSDVLARKTQSLSEAQRDFAQMAAEHEQLSKLMEHVHDQSLKLSADDALERFCGLDNALTQSTQQMQAGFARVSADVAQLAAQLDKVASDRQRANARHEELIDTIRQFEARVVSEFDHSRIGLAALSSASDSDATSLAGLFHGMQGFQSQIGVLTNMLAEEKDRLQVLEERADRAERELKIVQSSTSMWITSPLRKVASLGRILIRGLKQIVKVGVFFTLNPRELGRYFRLARRIQPTQVAGLIDGFVKRGGPQPATVGPEPVVFDLRGHQGPVVILTTRHCDYIGQLMASALGRVGISAEVIYERPLAGYSHVPHFVICPQMFPELPGFYVAFQLEQSVSSRWFTEDYISRLENSFAIFDYSLANISYLKERGLSLKQINYVPIHYMPELAGQYSNVNKSDDYDVVFYGDASCDRRRNFLDALSRVCRVRVVSEVFGDELYRILASAKIVVNIHYYPGALLETTRIWECLSLDCMIVSEQSSDMEEHEELQGVVDFVDVGDVDGMAQRVHYWLANATAREAAVERNRAALKDSLNRFDYFFMRFLLATDNIGFDQFWDEVGSRYKLKGDRICLNLPEFGERSSGFVADNKFGFEMFPGLRHSKGWVGCALSYKYMIKLADQAGLERVTICEDDVEFPANFEAELGRVNGYLDQRSERWSIFSGLLADLSNQAGILEVTDFEGCRFVTTDRLISTVLNVYDHSVFASITSWDEMNRDVETNTIDRFLESNGQLKVVTTMPFLVGHKEEEHSTIWGFQNTQYADLIKASCQLLSKKVGEYMKVQGRA